MFNWNLSFLEVADLNTQAFHEISSSEAYLDVKEDPIKVSSIDYFKIEARTAKIKFHNDAWLDTNLKPGIVGSNTISGSDYWNFAVRLRREREDGTEDSFTGYINRKSVKYSKKTDMFELTACDAIAILSDFGKEKTFLDSGEYDTEDLLSSSLALIIGRAENLNVDVNFNYDLVSGITVEDYQIYQSDYNLWQTGNQYIYWENSMSSFHNQTGSRIDTMFMKQGYHGYTELYQGWWYGWYTEVLHYEDVRIYRDDNVGIVGALDQTFVDNERFATEQSASDWVLEQTNTYYNQLYVSGGFPTTPVETASWLDDTYNVNEAGQIDLTGTLNFTSVDIKRGDDNNPQQIEYSPIGLVEALLLLNNLTILVDGSGVINVNNKNQQSGRVKVIADEHVFKYNAGYVLKSIPNYTDIFSKYFSNPITLNDAVAEYYLGFFEEINQDIDLEIENQYTLNINDTIDVYDDSIQINSIELDKDEFYYKIKGWIL